jgi:hypothetical protein
MAGAVDVALHLILELRPLARECIVYLAIMLLRQARRLVSGLGPRPSGLVSGQKGHATDGWFQPL